ncbi:indolepyruvate ferredoxin oxidoreductase family protein [Acidocella aquatica]|nr:indolepyruvate ferredoxin oxidoreductase family protein [Acidocella aquatica]
MTKTAVQLDDKYTQEDGRLYLTSMQALVRLPIVQHRRDRAAGLNTAGFITGYRGSPIGTYDAALWAAGKLLTEHNIEFLPGVNEELAATSIRGAQQMEWFAGPKYDGVFGIWYGKGLGVDRATEALKMANFEGAAKHGGVLVVAGDDHAGKSSATCHQSEQALESAVIPILYPSNTQEILEFGLYGWAMSRYCGAWIALKATNDTLEVTASIHAENGRANIILPGDADFKMPAGGLNLRRNDFPAPQEDRAINVRPAAAQAFARVNGLDRIIIDGPRRELGIVTTGKPYLDVRQALSDLGIDDARAAQLGIRLYKLGLTWPLDPVGATAFARGHRQIFVIEEKRAFIETQLSRILFNMDAGRPSLVGKQDEAGRTLLPAAGDLNAAIIREALFNRLQALGLADAALEERMARIKAGYEKGINAVGSNVIRTAYFCSGCPHNTSTRIPEGSVAFQGVGCHALAAYFMPDRPHAWTGQMGSEGAIWLGLSPFVDGVKHVFQNLGDGTYFHSGILAIRAAVAAKRNITYKLLYNDAIAMTGGQPLEGELSVLQLAQQLFWEGVKPVIVVTDEPHKYPAVTWPDGTSIHHRDELDKIQRELREKPGVTAIIYDQTCASEKRRRRKRGKFPDPNKRVLINEDVCEGCGDCSVQSNCMSVQPLDTEFGRKRVIDQSSCNKDFSCLKGFCPSFVTVEGGTLRKAEASADGDVLTAALARIPLPAAAAMGANYDVLVTGIGGTGVLTVSAVLGMAAHIEGKGATIMDMTGMAQKGGAVLSHLRIGASPETIFAPRMGPGMASLILGCDLVVTSGKEVLQTARAGETRALVNSHVVPTAQFQANAKMDFGSGRLVKSIDDVVGAGLTHFVDATTLATGILGDSIATNMFMVGFAAQLGLLPLSIGSIEEAIRLNGISVSSNLRTFAWGRVAAAEPATAEAVASRVAAATRHDISQSLDEVIAKRLELLTSYQNAAWADAYSAVVEQVRKAESAISTDTVLTEAVARNLAKLMTYKDEYEVARLHASSAQAARLAASFDGDFKLKFHLAPPLLARKDPSSGLLRKMEFGPWVLPFFKLLQKGKILRATAFDIFGYTAERRTERRLIADYKAMILDLITRLTPANLAVAAELAGLPDEIRGFGHIKDANIAKAEARKAGLLNRASAAPK